MLAERRRTTVKHVRRIVHGVKGHAGRPRLNRGEPLRFARPASILPAASLGLYHVPQGSSERRGIQSRYAAASDERPEIPPARLPRRRPRATATPTRRVRRLNRAPRRVRGESRRTAREDHQHARLPRSRALRPVRHRRFVGHRLRRRCPRCGTDLHACAQCASFDPGSRFECMQTDSRREFRQRTRKTAARSSRRGPRSSAKRQRRAPTMRGRRSTTCSSSSPRTAGPPVAAAFRTGPADRLAADLAVIEIRSRPALLHPDDRRAGHGPHREADPRRAGRA